MDLTKLDEDSWRRLDKKSQSEIIRLLSSNKVFRRTYRNDPTAFVHDCFIWKDGDGPTFYQDDILSNLVIHRKEAVRGPHGLGKTAMHSWVGLWFALTRDEDEDWKVIATASAWRQLSHYLLPEINKWIRKLNWAKIGRNEFSTRELLKQSLKLKTGELFPIASDNHESLEGAHADALLFLFDECKAIKDQTFDALDGAFSGTGEIFAFAESTPGAPVGRFYEIHSKKPGLESWKTRHVTIDEAIRAGRIDPAWVEEHKQMWGEESSIYRQRVLGEFASDDENSVISLSDIERANQRWLEWKEAGGILLGDVTVGFDVAEGGNDRSALAYNYSDVISEVKTYSIGETMQMTGVVSSFMRDKNGLVVVDSNGVGNGSFSRLKELDVNVYGFKAQERSERRDRSGQLEFQDKRSEAWWNVREMLRANELALPIDDELTGDLTTPTWRFTSSGKVKIEEKKEIRKRIKRSTDKADAVVMSLYKPDVSSVDSIEDFDFYNYKEKKEVSYINQKQEMSKIEDAYTQYQKKLGKLSLEVNNE